MEVLPGFVGVAGLSPAAFKSSSSSDLESFQRLKQRVANAYQSWLVDPIDTFDRIEPAFGALDDSPQLMELEASLTRELALTMERMRLGENGAVADHEVVAAAPDVSDVQMRLLTAPSPSPSLDDGVIDAKDNPAQALDRVVAGDTPAPEADTTKIPDQAAAAPGDVGLKLRVGQDGETTQTSDSVTNSTPEPVATQSDVEAAAPASGRVIDASDRFGGTERPKEPDAVRADELLGALEQEGPTADDEWQDISDDEPDPAASSPAEAAPAPRTADQPSEYARPLRHDALRSKLPTSNVGPGELGRPDAEYSPSPLRREQFREPVGNFTSPSTSQILAQGLVAGVAGMAGASKAVVSAPVKAVGSALRALRSVRRDESDRIAQAAFKGSTLQSLTEHNVSGLERGVSDLREAVDELHADPKIAQVLASISEIAADERKDEAVIIKEMRDGGKYAALLPDWESAIANSPAYERFEEAGRGLVRRMSRDQPKIANTKDELLGRYQDAIEEGASLSHGIPARRGFDGKLMDTLHSKFVSFSELLGKVVQKIRDAIRGNTPDDAPSQPGP